MKNLNEAEHNLIEDIEIEKIIDDKLNFTGTQVNYYYVCKKKLWLFSHGLELEPDSDLVLLGKLLHERRYKRKLKEVQIGRIKIDFIEGKGEIHEIKRSRKIENAHVYQLLYYQYYLKNYAGLNVKGMLNYPLLRKRVEVNLDEEKEAELRNVLNDIDKIIHQQKPPEAVCISYCKTCAYRGLCWG
ncbi:MAG: CRISPR-associated protein Cas4 [archaeon]|nr:CRISPR-associated protein Cas4 [archaeon]